MGHRHKGGKPCPVHNAVKNSSIRKSKERLARRIIFHWLVFLVVASAVALMLQVLSDPFRPAGEHFAEVW